jgi:hypothetical protein
MDLAALAILSTFMGTALGRTIGISSPLRLTYRATFKIGLIYKCFYISGTRPIGQPIVYSNLHTTKCCALMSS